jgi:hypothetical protein
MEIAKLWTRSFDSTFLAAWSVATASGRPLNAAVQPAAERSETVRWNRLLGASARFKLPADVYGQDLVFAFRSFA